MEGRDVQTTLTGALGARGSELIALVGAGGKTTALQMLAEELTTTGTRVLATTTTAMFARQLSSVGPLLLQEDDTRPLAIRAGEALRGAGVVALARAHAADGKVKGLAPAAIDALWEARVAGSIVVEADGSRGLPLKAFGAAEPQVPRTATTVVLLAGLDVLGRRLDERHVHRAELLASALGVTTGTRVTPDLLSEALAHQVVKVRATAPAARVVVLLNKAEDDRLREQGVAAGTDLLSAAVGSCREPASGRPERIVVGSLGLDVYHVLDEAGR